MSGALIILIAGGVALRTPIDRQLRAWKLLPEPERLTELYFSDPNHLPVHYRPGQTQTVSFTTHNLEYQTTTYHYKIIESNQAPNRAQTLASGAFTLPADAYQRSSVKIIIDDPGPRVKVGVMLVNQNDSIDYLLERSGA